MRERQGFSNVGPAAAPQRRPDVRIRVDAPVTLSPGLGGVEATACDVSETGLKIETDNPPALGPIMLKMVGMPTFFGEVRWQAARHIGVRFARPLEPDHLETWVKAHGERRGRRP